MNAQTEHLEYCINNYYDWYLLANRIIHEADGDIELAANQLQEFVEQAVEGHNFNGFWCEVFVYGFMQHIQWDKLVEALAQE